LRLGICATLVKYFCNYLAKKCIGCHFLF